MIILLFSVGCSFSNDALVNDINIKEVNQPFIEVGEESSRSKVYFTKELCKCDFYFKGWMSK